MMAANEQGRSTAAGHVSAAVTHGSDGHASVTHRSEGPAGEIVTLPCDVTLARIAGNQSEALQVLTALRIQAPDVLARAIGRVVPLLDREPDRNRETDSRQAVPTAKRFAENDLLDKADPTFTHELVRRIVPVLAQHRVLDLIRLSLTTRDGGGPIAAVRDAFSREVANEGEGHGALMVTDVRRDGSEHAYVIGLVRESTERRVRLLTRWTALTGGRENRVQTVRGWRPFQQGHDSAGALHRSLHNIVGYAFKPLPTGDARDLDAQVSATGPFRDVWAAFRALHLRPEPSGALSRLTAINAGVTRECFACGAQLVGRSDRTTCSARCRKRLSRMGCVTSRLTEAGDDAGE